MTYVYHISNVLIFFVNGRNLYRDASFPNLGLNPRHPIITAKSGVSARLLNVLGQTSNVPICPGGMGVRLTSCYLL